VVVSYISIAAVQEITGLQPYWAHTYEEKTKKLGLFLTLKRKGEEYIFLYKSRVMQLVSPNFILIKLR